MFDSLLSFFWFAVYLQITNRGKNLSFKVLQESDQKLIFIEFREADRKSISYLLFLGKQRKYTTKKGNRQASSYFSEEGRKQKVKFSIIVGFDMQASVPVKQHML